MAPARGQRDHRSFLLQRAQPAMAGLLDGSLSTLAPILAVAFATHQPHYAFLAGLATAIGAGVSMAFSEGLWIRRRLFGTGFLGSFVSVTLGGTVIAAVSAALGAVR